MSNIDTLDIIALIWMIFNYIILCPIMIYSAYKFCSNIREYESLKKYRNKPLVCCLNIMMLFTLLCERPYANAVIIWQIIEINWIYYFVFSISWWSAFFLFFVKVFHLYYKQKYNIAIADLIWKKEINPDEANNNWFIVNKSSYGDPIYMIKIVSIPFLISVFINTLISYIYKEGLILDFTQYIIASLPILASFIIFYKSKNLSDIYKIRNEIFIQCIIIIIALSIYLGIFLYFKLDSNWINNPDGIRIEWLFRNLVANLCAVGLALIPTIYPLYLYQSAEVMKLSQLVSQVTDNTPIPSKNGDGVGTGFPSNPDTELTEVTNEFGETLTIINLKRIISEYETFKYFMQHLV